MPTSLTASAATRWPSVGLLWSVCRRGACFAKAAPPSTQAKENAASAHTSRRLRRRFGTERGKGGPQRGGAQPWACGSASDASQRDRIVLPRTGEPVAQLAPVPLDADLVPPLALDRAAGVVERQRRLNRGEGLAEIGASLAHDGEAGRERRDPDDLLGEDC